MDLRGHLVGFSYHPGAVSTTIDEHTTKSRLYCAKSTDAPSDELPTEDEARECAELFNQHWLSHGEEPILESEHQLHIDLSQLAALESLKRTAGECISKRGVGSGSPTHSPAPGQSSLTPKLDGSKIDSYVTDP